MSERKEISYFSSARFGGISSSTLKIIAIATMFIDHFAVVFETQLSEHYPFLILPNGLNFLRAVGRLAFPLFAFMIAEGAKRTHNIYLYLVRLLAFSFIAEIPFDLALYGTPLREVLSERDHQNVFFTLFLGLVSILCFQLLEKVNLEPLSVLPLAGLAYLAEEILKTDYGAMGVICIFLFYLFLQAKPAAKNIGFLLICLVISFMLSAEPSVRTVQYVSGETGHIYTLTLSALFNSYEIYALFSAPLIIFYNGEKGRKINKYFFYAFYPAHLLLLWGVYQLFS